MNARRVWFRRLRPSDSKPLMPAPQLRATVEASATRPAELPIPAPENPQSVPRGNDGDPTYCCETCEVFTDLIGRVRRARAEVATLMGAEVGPDGTWL